MQKKRLIVEPISRFYIKLDMPSVFHDLLYHDCATTKTYLYCYFSFFITFREQI